MVLFQGFRAGHGLAGLAGLAGKFVWRMGLDGGRDVRGKSEIARNTEYAG